MSPSKSKARGSVRAAYASQSQARSWRQEVAILRKFSTDKIFGTWSF